MSGYTFQERFDPDAGRNGKFIREHAQLPGVFTYEDGAIKIQLDYWDNGEFGLCQKLKIYARVDNDLEGKPIWQDVDLVKDRNKIASTLRYVTRLFLFKALGWPDWEELRDSLEWQEIGKPPKPKLELWYPLGKQ